jgi:ABC-2 type transport system permease protein
MNKFWVLLKKEIKELLSPQMLAPMVAVVLIFFFIGNVLSKEAEKSKTTVNLALLDLDRSANSEEAEGALRKVFQNILVLDDATAEGGLKAIKDKKIPTLIVIPAGFGSGITQNKSQEVEFYSVLGSLSMFQNRQAQSVAQATAVLNQYFSDRILASSSIAPLSFIKGPIKPNEFVATKDKLANVSFAQIGGLVISQGMFVPIILFMVIVVASQLVAVAIATEKENKTLETLLSVPVNRKSIVIAKLVAAGFVALLTAVMYLFGFKSYMGGITGSVGGAGQVADGVRQAATALGLTFGTTEYALLGISLFLGILAALSIAIVLGSFAEDVKAVQGLTTPIMILIFIPYLLTIFVDLNTASPFLRYLVYAIPFSYPFLASSHILFKDYLAYVIGNIYLLIFFLVFVFLAAKIFSTDKILTLKLKFRRSKQ